MDCWNYCCLTQANCHTLLPDGKFQRGKKKVSVHDVQEWSLRLRENKLSLDEFNIRKKQSQIQKMIGFTNEDQKEKEITEGLTLLTINKEKSIEESPKKQKKDDQLNKFEEALISREKSIRAKEKLLDDMLVFCEASFEMNNTGKKDIFHSSATSD